MANGKELLSDDLLYQREEASRAQHREPSEPVADAVRTYLDEHGWAQGG
jgi:metal-responsive CopG/Arc/MetJ family transcriptional regulator